MIFFMAPARSHAVPAGFAASSKPIAEEQEESTPAAEPDFTEQKPDRSPSVGKTTPARPIPTSPSDAMVLSSWNLVFSWKGPSGRHTYRLQVSIRPSFNPAILDVVTPTKSYSAVAALPPGSYYWRVKTMNAFRTSSAWSRTGEFRIPDMPPSNLMARDFINRGEESTESNSVTLALSAASQSGISGYRISENPAPPAPNDPGWVAIKPLPFYSFPRSFTLSSGDGVKTISVWYKDTAGRISSAATGTIMLDTQPPVVTITSSPTGTSDSSAVAFSFTASKPGATFRCKLDSDDYAACISPKSYDAISLGRHTFSIIATNAAGDKVSRPTSFTWLAISPVNNATASNFVNKGNSRISTQKTMMLALSASASLGRNIVAYYASENPETPDASDPGWKPVKPANKYSGRVPFTLSEGNGTKKVYVWFKDSEGKVSEGKSGSIIRFGSTALVIMFILIQIALLI